MLGWLTKVIVVMRRESWSVIMKPNDSMSGVSLVKLIHLFSRLKLILVKCVDALVVLCGGQDTELNCLVIGYCILNFCKGLFCGLDIPAQKMTFFFLLFGVLLSYRSHPANMSSEIYLWIIKKSWLKNITRLNSFH